MELMLNTTPPYPIIFKQNLLSTDLIAQDCKKLAQKVVIISDDTVAALYGHQLKQLLEKNNLTAHLLTFPPGEHHKTRETKATLEDQLFAHQCMRDTCVIALGGGIVTDVAGFVAATYCRGIPVIYIPTTMLAMVDASIGGKTGVNTPWGKNLIGTFTQPTKVYVDVNFLGTLPSEEFNDGMAEVIKHALIADKSLFDLISSNTVSLQNKDELQKVIYRSCDIKRSIVEDDPFEKNKRKLLNLGHTAGHAIEAASHYEIKHGAAVAIGIIIEGLFAVQLGRMNVAHIKTLEQVLTRYQLPTTLPAHLNTDNLIPFFTMDKKVQNAQIYCVLLEDLGKPYVDNGRYAHPISLDLIKTVIANFLKQ